MLSDDQKKSFYARIVKTETCWIWEGYRRSDGYGYVKFNGNNYLAHRLSWMLAKGSIPKGMHILHKCDNPPCVNPDHLFLGTQADNVQDMWAKGRGNSGHLLGEESHLSKLTETQVMKIRLSNKPLHILAKQFNISPTNVTDIQKGKVWKHLPYDVNRMNEDKRYKLTEEDVLEIRKSKESSTILARRYGVTPRNISDVRYGHTWKDLEGFQEVAEIAPSNVVKLTEDDVRLIRLSAETNVSLSKKYGVSQQTICDIKKRRSWKHVK